MKIERETRLKIYNVVRLNIYINRFAVAEEAANVSIRAQPMCTRYIYCVLGAKHMAHDEMFLHWTNKSPNVNKHQALDLLNRVV